MGYKVIQKVENINPFIKLFGGNYVTLDGYNGLIQNLILDDNKCCVYPELSNNNIIAYIVVKIQEDKCEILGFAKPETIKNEDLFIDQLESIYSFFEFLECYKIETSSIILSDWIDNISRSDWETVSIIYNQINNIVISYNSQLVFEDCGYRSSVYQLKSPSEPRTSAGVIQKGKLIDLTGEQEKLVGLFVGIKPVDSSKMEISVEVIPIDLLEELPRKLQVSILSNSGEILMEAQAQTPKQIYLDFKTLLSFSFSINIIWGDIEFTHHLKV